MFAVFRAPATYLWLSFGVTSFSLFSLLFILAIRLNDTFFSSVLSYLPGILAFFSIVSVMASFLGMMCLRINVFKNYRFEINVGCWICACIVPLCSFTFILMYHSGSKTTQLAHEALDFVQVNPDDPRVLILKEILKWDSLQESEKLNALKEYVKDRTERVSVPFLVLSLIWTVILSFFLYYEKKQYLQGYRDDDGRQYLTDVQSE